MVKCLRLAVAAAILGSYSASAESETLRPVVPVYTDGPNFTTTLEGWSSDPKPHSENRIVYRQGGYEFARMLSIDTPDLDTATSPSDFETTIEKALKFESVSDVAFVQVRDIDSPVTEAFRRETGITDGSFKAWIISGTSAGLDIKGAGFSIITAEAAEPGTSVEVFLATPGEYENMGGVMVPMARLFKVYLTNPEVDLLTTGQTSDEEAIEIMAAQFEQFMINIIRGKIVAGTAQQQTLAIIQGLDQTTDYGLQDPIYGLDR